MNCWGGGAAWAALSGMADDRCVTNVNYFCNGITSKFQIHRLTYYDVRERFGLSAQLAVRAISKVADALNRRKG